MIKENVEKYCKRKWNNDINFLKYRKNNGNKTTWLSTLLSSFQDGLSFEISILKTRANVFLGEYYRKVDYGNFRCHNIKVIYSISEFLNVTVSPLCDGAHFC